MISPDAAAELRAERRFDMAAAALIGAIAVLAALLAIIQIHNGQSSTRASAEVARLSADTSAHTSAYTVVALSDLSLTQTVAAVMAEAEGRERAGQGNDAALARAQKDAANMLQAALGRTSATSGGAPLDAYGASLATATLDRTSAKLAQLSQQKDIVEDAGSREQKAILGLSFLALSGVLTGLGAVLNEGRAGWISLLAAATMAAAAGVTAVLAVV
jgi:hypothetical protein